MSNVIYCIGRQYGSGGRAIARLISEKLNIPLYDKELLTEIFKESGISKELLEDYDEKPTSSFLYSLSLGAYSYGASLSGVPEMPLSDKIFLIQSETVKKLADKGSCVFVGRCADEILSDYPNVFSVFVYNDMDYRSNRIQTLKHVSEDEAISRIKKRDKKRATYHNYYSDKRWGEATSYDMCIKSSIGLEKAADIIIAAASDK